MHSIRFILSNTRAPRTARCSSRTRSLWLNWTASWTPIKAKNIALNHPALESGVTNQNDNLPELSRMQMELLINSFVNDFARVATLQFTKSVGGARMNWLDINCLLYTSPSPRDATLSRMPSSA